MKRNLFTIALVVLAVGLLGSCKKGNDPESPKLQEGVLPGAFTVNAEGRTVYFSKGNLQATVDAAGAPTSWRFAANQYDCVGEGGANKVIGQAAGDVDLFGWSTAGSNFGISASTSDSVYYGDFVDWGKAFCEYKKLADSIWRTLSKDEWKYLVTTRTVNGGEGMNKSFSYDITYGGIVGAVLYPDDYTGPALSGTVNTLPEGVVFLPSAGYRYGSKVGDVGSSCEYWSSSAYDEDDAYLAVFYSGGVDPDDDVPRLYGYAVRLVTESKYITEK